MGVCHSRKQKSKPTQVQENKIPSIHISQPINENISKTKPTMNSQNILTGVVKNCSISIIEPPSPKSLSKSQIISSKCELEIKEGLFKKYTMISSNVEIDQTMICQHNQTGQLVKVEILNISNQNDQKYIKMVQELDQSSPYIAKYVELFKEKNKLYLLQEYSTFGTLSKFIKNQNLSDIKNIMYQLIQAIFNLHNNNYFHGALCLDSFQLYEKNGWLIKLQDLKPIFQISGISTNTKIKNQNENFQESKKLQFQYSPPKETISFESDIWALGIIFHQLLTGKIPDRPKFQDGCLIWEPKKQLITQPIEIRNLIDNMLKLDSKERISFQSIINQNIFNSTQNSICKYIIENFTQLKKISYLQKTIIIFIMKNFYPYYYQIFNIVFNNIDNTNKQEITVDQLYTFIKQSSISFNFIKLSKLEYKESSLINFLIISINKNEILNQEYLTNCFKMLSNKDGVLQTKSICKKCYANNELIFEELSQLSYNGTLTLNDFLNLMFLVKNP